MLQLLPENDRKRGQIVTVAIVALLQVSSSHKAPTASSLLVRARGATSAFIFPLLQMHLALCKTVSVGRLTWPGYFLLLDLPHKPSLAGHTAHQSYLASGEMLVKAGG